MLLLSNYIPNSVIKRNTYRDSLAVYNKVNNSVFIINIIMVSCLWTLYKIKPPNNLIINA